MILPWNQNSINMSENIIKKGHIKKYPEMIDVLRKLRFDDEVINNMLTEYEQLLGWEPITIRELRMMEESEWKELKSYVWKYGEPRCQSIGITNLKFSEGKIEYSDSEGDPTMYIDGLDEKLHKIGQGKWVYGLYKRVK